MLAEYRYAHKLKTTGKGALAHGIHVGQAPAVNAITVGVNENLFEMTECGTPIACNGVLYNGIFGERYPAVNSVEELDRLGSLASWPG